MDQLETDGIATFPAIRKKRVTQQKQRGSGLIRMADFVDAGLLHALARIERAIRLIVLEWV